MDDSIGEICATDATNDGVANGDNIGEQLALGGTANQRIGRPLRR